MTSARGAAQSCSLGPSNCVAPAGARRHFCRLPRAYAPGYLLNAPTALGYHVKAMWIALTPTYLGSIDNVFALRPYTNFSSVRLILHSQQPRDTSVVKLLVSFVSEKKSSIV